jgi:hypothetical protein
MKQLANDAGLTSETITQIEAGIAGIKNLMPWLVGLSTTDRQKLSVVGSKTTQFVQRAADSIRQNPELAPSFLDAEHLISRYKLYNDLLAILEPVQLLDRMISDTMMLAGSDAYSDALDYYNTVKRGAKSNVPGAQAVADNLKTRFRKSGRSGDTGSDAAASVASGG